MGGRGAEGVLAVGRMSVALAVGGSVGCWFSWVLPTAVPTAGQQGLGCGCGVRGTQGGPLPLHPTPLPALRKAATVVKERGTRQQVVLNPVTTSHQRCDLGAVTGPLGPLHEGQRRVFVKLRGGSLLLLQGLL